MTFTFPQSDSGDPNEADIPFDLPFEEEEEEEEEMEGERKWPGGPSRAPTAPLPFPSPSTWEGKRHGLDHERRREARERQTALRRQEMALEHQLRRLDAQESAISAQWAALPSPPSLPSLLKRLLIALAVLSGIVVLFHFFPLLLVPLIVVLLVMAKVRRYQPPTTSRRNDWARQERERLESRWSGIVAERTATRQHLASIQRELSQFAP